MGGGRRNWARDKARQQIAVAMRDARDRDAYLDEWAQARRGQVPPSKAQLRQEADAAVVAVLAARPIGRPWSLWVEVMPDQLAPLTGQPYTATITGWMWSRER